MWVQNQDRQLLLHQFLQENPQGKGFSRAGTAEDADMGIFGQGPVIHDKGNPRLGQNALPLPVEEGHPGQVRGEAGRQFLRSPDDPQHQTPVGILGKE